MYNQDIRHIVIGDVHGCVLELNQLISDLSIQKNDMIYFIGDLIDRGPDSAGAVKLAREMVSRHGGALLLGNHEAKYLRFLHNLANNRSALESMKGVDRYYKLMSELNDADMEFLRKGYYTYRIGEQRKYLLLHGGIPGNCKLTFDVNHAYHDYPGKPPKDLELILMTRYVDEHGKFLSLGSEPENKRFWAEAYDGKWGFVVFGHNHSLSIPPAAFNHALNIDTGCAYGGWLTAAILTETSREIETYSVKSNQTQNGK